MNNQSGLAIHIENINKKFSAANVLNQLNIDIAANDFVSIIGKSGCGKSTLLRLLANLTQPSSGKINFYENEQLVENSANDVRLMFQDSRLLPWKSVIDNVRLGLTEKTSLIRAKEVLNDVGLSEKIDEWPDNLSGGQKQRVALARALIRRPKVLLLDEPLGALDALTRLEMQQLIEKLWRLYQFTIVLVTHDINEAVITSNRVIILEQGSIGMDVKIPLSRPRTNLTEIARYEQMLMSKLIQAPTIDFEI